MNNNNGRTSGGGGGGFELGILYVIFQVIDVGIGDIPYVTLLTIIGQVLLYMRVVRVPWTNYEVCINVLAIVEKKDYRRLLLAVFEHANDMHLYYNMMSYLIKGKYLEKKYGSKNFACLLIFLALCSTSIDVLLCYLFSKWLKSPYLMNACGIGFSGVLYAFKVIIYMETAHLPWGINGLPIDSKYIAWIELLVFHILTPDASFLGHLAGILAGVLYTSSPIGFIFDSLVSVVTGNSFEIFVLVHRKQSAIFTQLRRLDCIIMLYILLCLSGQDSNKILRRPLVKIITYATFCYFMSSILHMSIFYAIVINSSLTEYCIR